MEEAIDWSDPDSVAIAENMDSTIEGRTKVHRLVSTDRSLYDAFAYVNRIPEKPNTEEGSEDFAGRIFSRLANQEGRIQLKLPPGMNRQAYEGYKIFMQYDGKTKVGNCAACHTPENFADGKTHVVNSGAKAVRTPSLRNLSLIHI